MIPFERHIDGIYLNIHRPNRPQKRVRLWPKPMKCSRNHASLRTTFSSRRTRNSTPQFVKFIENLGIFLLDRRGVTTFVLFCKNRSRMHPTPHKMRVDIHYFFDRRMICACVKCCEPSNIVHCVGILLLFFLKLETRNSKLESSLYYVCAM